MLVLVGGTGFIGKHLSVLLHARGIAACIVSRAPDAEFIERHAPSLKTMNLDAFAGEAGRSLLCTAQAVVYLATQSIPISNAEAPWREVSDSVLPAFKLFDRIYKESAAARIILVSSGGMVYGVGHRKPIEETAPTAPTNAYGLGKVLTEQCLEFLGRTANGRFAILRVSNPAGRFQNNPRQGFIGVAMRAFRDGRPMNIYAGGTQIRDFIDCDDVADAILTVATSGQISGGVCNVGSGCGTSIIDVLRLIENASGRKAAINEFPGRPSDIPYNVLNVRKMDEIYGWRPRKQLEDLITELWQDGAEHTKL